MNFEFEQIISTLVRDWMLTKMWRYLLRWKQYWEYNTLDLKVPFQRTQWANQESASARGNFILMFAVA